MCKIGIIDSGAGGISTLSSILSLLPNEDYIYVSDKSHSPYGDKSGEFIYNRISNICRMLQRQGVSAVVIACNTATAAGIERLRESFKDLSILGVEPAVKPAVEELLFGKALVLLTPSAALQPRFVSLIKRFDSKKIIVSPQQNLAALIEKNTDNLPVINSEVTKMLSPLKTPLIESVVLGCTHYCLIKDQIANIFFAKIYDGNMGVALRLYNLLKQNKMISRTMGGCIRFIRL